MMGEEDEATDNDKEKETDGGNAKWESRNLVMKGEEDVLDPLSIESTS